MAARALFTIRYLRGNSVQRQFPVGYPSLPQAESEVKAVAYQEREKLRKWKWPIKRSYIVELLDAAGHVIATLSLFDMKLVRKSSSAPAPKAPAPKKPAPKKPAPVTAKQVIERAPRKKGQITVEWLCRGPRRAGCGGSASRVVR